MGVAPLPLAAFSFAGADFAAAVFLAVWVFTAGFAGAALAAVLVGTFDTDAEAAFFAGGFAAALLGVSGFLLDDVAFDTDMGITSRLKKLSLKYSTDFHDNTIKCFVEINTSTACAKRGIRQIRRARKIK